MRRSRTPLPGRMASVGLAWTSTMPRASSIRRSSGSKGHRGSPRGGRWRGPRRVEHPREPERRMRRHARAVRPSPTRCPPTSARRRSPWVHRAPAEPSASKLRRSSRPCRVVAVVGKASLGISLFRARLLFRDEFRMSAPPPSAPASFGESSGVGRVRGVYARVYSRARYVSGRVGTLSVKCGGRPRPVGDLDVGAKSRKCWERKNRKTHGRVRFHFFCV